MRYPQCDVCQAEGPTAGLTLVRFNDYQAPPLVELDGRLLPLPGHPRGLMYICANHLAAAQARQHLPSEQAIAEIRAAGNEANHGH